MSAVPSPSRSSISPDSLLRIVKPIVRVPNQARIWPLPAHGSARILQAAYKESSESHTSSRVIIYYIIEARFVIPRSVCERLADELQSDLLPRPRSRVDNK